MSYGRMVPAEAALAAEVAGWLAAAEAADAADAAALGADRRGDELPDWVAAKALRLARIREAKAALQAQAQAAADAGKPAAADPAPSPRRGRPPKTPPGTPEAKAQRNFTAPDSRIMKTKDGFIQGSNGQAAVAGGQQAHGLTNRGSDQGQLTPLLDAIRTNTGRQPKEVSAAAGYGSEANLEALEERAIRGSIATGRQRHGQAAATGPIASMGRQHGPRLRAMRQRLQRGGLRSRCASRSSPVRSSRPGASASSCCGAWPRSGALICTAHNLLKLTRALA